LVRTGVDHAALQLNRNLDPGPGRIELSYVPRTTVIRLMAAADVLVQPGKPGPFNDPRFPSKVPEFLISGRPVVLSASNIGRVLKHGAEAWVMPRGTMDEIATALQDLWRAPEMRLRLGEGGRAFAQKNLTWDGAARVLAALYRRIA
jgi:glycosyltransferase involved in cell wall biosynthesis